MTATVYVGIFPFVLVSFMAVFLCKNETKHSQTIYTIDWLRNGKWWNGKLQTGKLPKSEMKCYTKFKI